MTTDIRDDGRAIKSIGSAPWPADWGWLVGYQGVTKIEPYPESGQMAEVTWFAVYVGDEIRYRVPAATFIVKYAPAEEVPA